MIYVFVIASDPSERRTLLLGPMLQGHGEGRPFEGVGAAPDSSDRADHPAAAAKRSVGKGDEPGIGRRGGSGDP